MHCPNCNNEIPKGEKSCGSCGHRLAPAESVTAPASIRTPSSWKWVAGIGAIVVMVVGLVIALASRGKPAVPPRSSPETVASPLGTAMPTSTSGAFVSPLGIPTSGAFVSPLSTPTPRPGALYSDDFGDPESGWYEGSYENKEYRYEDGEYVILVKGNDLAAWVSWPKEKFKNFALEADVRLVEGPKAVKMGLVFRLGEKGNFYLFLIDDYGQYIVGKDVNGEWQGVAGMETGWVISPHIRTGGATNHLKVICQGPQIALYANDHHLTTVSDDSFAEGKIGLIAASVKESEPVKVAFDNLVVSMAEDIP